MADSGRAPAHDTRRRSSKQSTKSTSSTSSHNRPKSDTGRNVTTSKQSSSSQSHPLAARPALQERTYSEPSKRRPDRRTPSGSKLNVSPTQSQTFLFRPSLDHSGPVSDSPGTQGEAPGGKSYERDSVGVSRPAGSDAPTEVAQDLSPDSSKGVFYSTSKNANLTGANVILEASRQENMSLATVAAQASDDVAVQELAPGSETPKARSESPTETRNRRSLHVPSLSGKRSPHSFLNLEDSPRPSFGQTFENDHDLDQPEELLHGPTRNISSPTESTLTFSELARHLLSPAWCKEHPKFVTTLLTLYRFFATPSQLLDVIIKHFDANNLNDITPWIHEPTLDRDLQILDQWINAFPGDFAKQSTRYKLYTFCSRVSKEHRIVHEEPIGGLTEYNEPSLADHVGNTARLAQSAQQILFVLNYVQEDDDTDWGYSDEGVVKRRTNTFLSVSSAESQADSDTPGRTEPFSKISSSNPVHDMGLIFGGQSTLTLNAMGSSRPSTKYDQTSSSHTLLDVAESAQRQAAHLSPTSTYSFNKTIWRGLIAQPDDLMAREITRTDWIMFSAIRPRDLIRHVTLPASERENYRSLQYVTRMTDQFNHLAYWVTNIILFRDKAKHRAQALEKFMRLARRLRDLNNYNGLGAIIAGIQGSAVYRLNATKELVPQNVARDFMKLEILMAATRGHWAYRLAWENTTTQRIPFLPLHRRDLIVADAGGKTFPDAPQPTDTTPPTLEVLHLTDEATPSKAANHAHARSKSRPTPNTQTGSKPNTKPSPSQAAALKDSKKDRARPPTGPQAQPATSEPRINWHKFTLIGDVIHTLQAAQLTPYPAFPTNDEVRAMILDHRLITDDDKLYERSVALEPGAATAAALGRTLSSQSVASAGSGSGSGQPAAGAVSTFNDPNVRRKVMEKIGLLVG